LLETTLSRWLCALTAEPETWNTLNRDIAISYRHEAPAAPVTRACAAPLTGRAAAIMAARQPSIIPRHLPKVMFIAR
jgi:hypothetical protein